MKHFGRVKKGILKLNNKQLFDDQLQQYEGKEVVIKIVERNNNRTKD